MKREARAPIERLFATLCVGLAALMTVGALAEVTVWASRSILGRDQGIFQYVAWAVRHGERDYKDVRDVNGPLTHAIHVVFQWLGGERESVFRRWDLAVSYAAFFVGGAALPALVALRAEDRPRWSERAAWGGAACAGLGTQYLRYLYWDLAQRESFCDWFVLVALFFVAEALAPWSLGRRRDACTAAAAFFGTLPVFGKHTYLLFAVAFAIAFFTLRSPTQSPWPKKTRVAAMGVGAAGACLLVLAYLLVYGDVSAFARIYFVDAPRVYTYIWPMPARDILTRPWVGHDVWFAGVGAALVLACVLLRALPRRALLVACVAPLGIASVLLHRKGFPYHYHPLTLGNALDALLLACGLWSGAVHGARGWVRAASLSVLGLALAGGVIVVRRGLATSWFAITPWFGDAYADEAVRARPEYLVRYAFAEIHPDELAVTADYVAKSTPPGSRVQTYGMDPYLLFQARRFSASPYIYAYDLNADAALNGAAETLPPGPKLDATRAVIETFAREHGAHLLARLEAAPPAAFVFVDGSPLMSHESAVRDLLAHQPDVGRFVEQRYVQTYAAWHTHVFEPKKHELR